MPAEFLQDPATVEGDECDWKGARALGVAAFRANDLSKADEHFRDALGRLAPVIVGDETNGPLGDARDGAGIDEIPAYETWTKGHASELLCCRAAVLLRQHRYRDALRQAERAQELREDWAKPAMQCAKARFGLGQYEKALELTRVENLQQTPELKAEAKKLRDRIEKKAYGKVVAPADERPAPKPPARPPPMKEDPSKWDGTKLRLPDECKDMLAAILARCEAPDAVALLEEAQDKVDRDGEATRDAVMCPLMIRLQSDALVDFGYEPGEKGVATFGMEMRKACRGFPDDEEFRELIAELSSYGRPRGTKVRPPPGRGGV